MIAVIGLGFVGLTTALGFAEQGERVIGIDVDTRKTNQLLQGKIPFHEPGLPDALNRHLGNLLTVSNEIDDQVVACDVIFICVGTPSNPDGSADLGYIESAIHACGDIIRQGPRKTVVIKSTVPPGTTAGAVTQFVRAAGLVPGADVGLAVNPEFLREGVAWSDFMSPDRIVLGVADEVSAKALTALYQSFRRPIHCVSANEAEFIKYLSNSYLATSISFANELSMIAMELGDIDVSRAFRIFHEDGRWFGEPSSMKNYVYPGCGFGGYCLPKDTLALQQSAQQASLPAPLLSAVLEVNRDIKPYLISKITAQVNRGDVIGVLGLSFKPDSDDVRQSPSAEVIRLLLDAGYSIVAYDPLANSAFDEVYNYSIDYADSIEDVVQKAAAVVITTGWKEFVEKRDVFADRVVFDFRYIL